MAARPITFGAAYTFSEAQLRGDVRVNLKNPTVTTTAAQLVENNADRVELTIFNTGANPIFVLPGEGVSLTNGIQLVANTGFITFKLRDDFALTGYDFSAIASGGSSVITVIEVIRNSVTNPTV